VSGEASGRLDWYKEITFTQLTIPFKTHVWSTACFSIKPVVFCARDTCGLYVTLKINSNYFPKRHKLEGICNKEGVCLLRGRN
jgi:hypothetical protein